LLGVFSTLATATQINVQMEFDNLTDKYDQLFKKYRSDIDFQIRKKGCGNANYLRNEFSILYLEICKISEKENRHFLGSTFEQYQKHLEQRTQSQDKHLNFSLYNFYKDEYKDQWHSSLKTPDKFKPLEEEILVDLKKTILKRLEFLELKMFEMGIDVIKTYDPELGRTNISLKDNLERRFNYEKKQKPIPPTSNIVKWNGNNVELAELIKALIESNKLETTGLTQSEIFKRFSLFFNYEINETTGIKDFSKRKNTGGKLTKFLDILKDNLDNWYTTKEEKKRNSR